MCCRGPMRHHGHHGRHGGHPRWGWGPPGARRGGPWWAGRHHEEEVEEEAPFGFHRHFESKAEKAERLERYLQALEAEAEAVRERLAELRGTD